MIDTKETNGEETNRVATKEEVKAAVDKVMKESSALLERLAKQ